MNLSTSARRVIVVQAQLELVAEQRAQALTVANSFNQRERNAYSIGREIDRELSGFVPPDCGGDESGAKNRCGIRVRNRRRVNVAAVLCIGHQAEPCRENEQQDRPEAEPARVDRSRDAALRPRRMRRGKGRFLAGCSCPGASCVSMCWLTSPSSQAS